MNRRTLARVARLARPLCQPRALFAVGLVAIVAAHAGADEFGGLFVMRPDGTEVPRSSKWRAIRT